MSKNDGVVNIHGKEYHTVAKRVGDFRAEFGHTYTIETEIISADGEIVVMKASIKNHEGVTVATGHAEEVRGSTNINKTSALENCETSAIGRALSSFGLAGIEFASADEVANAINQQKEMQQVERLIRHNKAVLDNLESVYRIKNAMAVDNYSEAAEAWFELDDKTKMDLWVAPSKGGLLSTQERAIMKTNEFRDAYTGYSESGDLGEDDILNEVNQP